MSTILAAGKMLEKMYKLKNLAGINKYVKKFVY